MDAQQLLEIIFVAMFGLMFGSFSTMASYRLPRGEDVVFKPSRCPSCEHQLRILDLFPVFSWLLNKGRCRHCKSSVSSRYPLIELATGLLFVLIYLKTGISIESASLWGLAVCLVILAVADMEHDTMPGLTLWGMALCGALYNWTLNIPLIDMAVGAVFAIFVALALRMLCRLTHIWTWFGWRVAAFCAVAGLFLGAKLFVIFAAATLVVGCALHLVYITLGKKTFSVGLPLALALFTCLIVKQSIASLFF